MFTFGEFPWLGTSDAEVARKVRRGEVMLRPSNCPESVHEIMIQCWQVNPDARVSASELEEKLKKTDIYTLRRIVPEDRGEKWE